MFQHAFDPVAFSLGPLAIRWYGLVYAAGFLFLYYYLTRHATDVIDGRLVEDYIVWTIIGVILGSRVFTFLFWYPGVLLDNPLRFFAVWQGGMSFHGAYTGMVAASLWYCRRHDISFHDLADTVSIPLGVFLGLGRVTNFVNAELVGTPYDGSWCIDYPQEKLPSGLADVCRHPYQIYAALKNAALTPLAWLTNARFNLRSGVLFWSWTVAYNVLRFFTDFYRAEPSTFLGLSTGQILCVAFTGIASYMLVVVSQDA